jgi:ABC-2 type transport system permease protein
MGKRIASLFRKEFIQIVRDKRTLAMMIAIPLIWIILFGYAATFDVPYIEAVVTVPEGSPSAELLVDALEESDHFRVVETGPFTDDELRAAVEEGRASVGIRPPEPGTPGYFVTDGSDLFVAQAAVQQLQAVIRTMAEQTGGTTYVVTEFLYNPDLDSVNYMIPGLVGIVMVFIATLLTAIAVVRERERGTMEQLLVTPASPMEIMVGKIVPYMIVAFIDFILVIICGVFVFDVPMAGSALLLVAMGLAFLLVCLGIGLLVSTVSHTQQQAMQLAVFTLVPQILLSGFIFPLAGIPWAVRWLAYLFPLTYFLPISRGIFLRGEGLSELWVWAVILIGYAIVVVSLAAWRFKRKLV